MSRKKKSTSQRLMPLVLVGGAALLAWWAAPDSWFQEDTGIVIDGAAVSRGPLRISVVERGNLKAAKSVDLASEVEGRTTVLYLIEEGSMVEAGELVAELDTASLLERRVAQEITVQNTEAGHIAAKQQLAIQKSQNQSDLDAAQRKIDFAKIDLEKYIKGDWPQQLRKADDDILLAEATLKQSQDRCGYSKNLHELGFLTRTELESDELDLQKSELNLALVKRQRELLIEYDNLRQIKTLEADVAEAESEYERIKLRAEARLVDYEADTRTTEARRDLEGERLQKIIDQIDKARIHAPVPGMVVYYMESGGRWGNREPMQEGAEVRERQKIITMPQTEGMIAEVSLHEAVLEQVVEGQPCVVTVDALPDRQFPGVVKYKAALPDQNSWFANPNQRLYRTEIALTGTSTEMRPGMSCNVEILVEDFDDVVYAPLQSVFPDGTDSVAFVSGSGGVEKRTIELGRNNTTYVQVRDGLAPGEIVLLAQPAGFELAPAESEDAQFDTPTGMPGASGAGARPGAGAGGEGGGRPSGEWKSRDKPGGGSRAGGERPAKGARPGAGGGGGGRPGRDS